MVTANKATIDDLYKVPDGRKAELVEGELRIMSPTGGVPGRASARIFRSLEDYEIDTGRGYAIPHNVGFVVDLPSRESFSPDAAFYIGPEPGMRFLTGAPIFAVEVRSENDYGPAAEQDMAAKRRDYFAAGTVVVWDVDLIGPEVVRCYRADNPEQPEVFRRGDIANAEPALPGWRMEVEDIFPHSRPGGTLSA